MNVIDAAFELGRELSASFVRNGGQLIDSAFLTSLFGDETSIRLRELFDFRCTRWGLFGYRQAIEILSSLEAKEGEAPPFDYWTPVKNAAMSNEALISAVESMSQEAARCSALVQMSLKGEMDISGEEYTLGVCDAYTTLCSALRRTGVFRSASKCLAELGQDGRDHLMETATELEKAFNQSLEHYVDESIADRHGMGDAFTALEGLVFLSILVEKAVFWGFENRRPVIAIEQCVSVPDYNGGIREMRLTTTNPSAAVDRVFSAIAVTDGGRLQFLLIPYKEEMNLMNGAFDITVTGISYPASDVRLFEAPRRLDDVS